MNLKGCWMANGIGLGTGHRSGYIPVMDSPEITGDKQDTRFKPGQSGNPAGRPKGARSKLGEAFIDALLADWQANGIKAIIDMRDDKPADYVKVVASLLPKEVSGPDGEPMEVRTLLGDGKAGRLSEATLREIAGLGDG